MLINGIEDVNLYNYDLSQDQIIIIDDLYPDWFQEYVWQQIFRTYSWTYGHTSTYKENDKFWDAGDPTENWEETPAFKQQIYPPYSANAQDSCWNMIYNSITRLIPFELSIGEIVVNGQQYIHNTVPHTDCECDNGITWIYYANKKWHESWGGETLVYFDDKWHSILPKPGRVALFKGKLPHHGLPPNDIYKGLRATLVYKTMRTEPLPPRQL